jgi:Leucine-rich repeat (LRR) protein
LAAVLKVAKKSAHYSNEILFAEVERQYHQDADTLQEITTAPQIVNHSSDFLSLDSHQQLYLKKLCHQLHKKALPGAFPVRRPGTYPQHDSIFLHNEIELFSNKTTQSDYYQLVPATLFNAILVEDPEIPSTSIFDQEAAEKAYCRRQGWRVLATFAAIGILGSIIAIVIWKLKPPADPSPTSSPLYNFLAGNSFDKGAALSTDGSSQQKALKWLEQSTLNNSALDYTLLQFYVLAVFNYATGETLSKLPSNTWLPNNGADSEYNFCDWVYITCNGEKDINYLIPSSSQIDGSLPPEIGLLTSLEILHLHNTFNGTLPTEKGHLKSLTDLLLHSNNFTGTLPTESGFLTRLHYLDLYSNTFTGTIPTEIGLLTGSLYRLALYSNSFTGTLHKEIGNLTSLYSLDLHSNNFNGTLPTEIGNLNSIIYLTLFSNDFTGTLPTDIGLLTSLTGLWLFSNTFTGTLPTEIGNLLNLTGDITLQNNTFSGSVPTEIVDFLKSLSTIGLSNNLFTGSVPSYYAGNIYNY